MRLEDALNIVKKQDPLMKAIKEARELEPLADENGVPSFNDTEGYAKIAESYGLDAERFEDHLDWLSSYGMIGKPYAL